MTYATVLLHLDDHPRMHARIDYAARLARRFESHLVGVSAADHSLFGLSALTSFAGPDCLEEAIESSHQAALLRVRHFREHVEMLAPNSFEAVIDQREVLEALTRRSACADLLIAGQPDPAWPDGARARGLLEQLVQHSVAPTLVMPYAGEFPHVGNHVLIAWDGSRGAARAVVGAMPLLQRAGKVSLLRCDTPVEADRKDEASELELPREWLGRHGVRINAWLEATPIDVGDALLSRASDLGADMLVMGAWGQPRWAERMLGGVTRTILSSMTLPVLMSH